MCEDLIRCALSDDWQNNARLNEPWVVDELVYTEGYRRGAQLLFEHAEKNQHDRNCLIYPIAYLYRHHIELVLKHIIKRAPSLIGRPLTPEEEQHLKKHSLDLLWQDLKPMFDNIRRAAGWDAPAPAIEAIDDCIHRLNLLDPKSTSFRYPRSLPPDVKEINIEEIERLAHLLSGLDSAVCHIGRSRD
jgi:hypothetical protein